MVNSSSNSSVPGNQSNNQQQNSTFPPHGLNNLIISGDAMYVPFSPPISPSTDQSIRDLNNYISRVRKQTEYTYAAIKVQFNNRK